MSLTSICNQWSSMINDEILFDMSPERRPYVKNKILFSSLESSVRCMISYLEAPSKRENMLVRALAYREFAENFCDENTDWEQLAEVVCDRQVGHADDTSEIEKPEWISDEEWEVAKEQALHDEGGKLLRPQIEGFITGAKYDMPCIYPSEFDEETVMKMVRAAVHAALAKTEADKQFVLRRLNQPNSNYWKSIWMNKSWDAKQDHELVLAFIKNHNLQYED